MMNCEGMDVRTVGKFRFDCDETPGGFLASYGCGPIGAGVDAVERGYGRSPRACAVDAIERMREVYFLPEVSWDALEEAAERLSDSEAQCEAFEREAADEACRERFGRGLDDCTHDEQQVAWDSCAMSDPAELLGVFLIDWA